MDEAARKVKARMERLCARREYCSSEILSKIKSALGEGDSSAGEILESLVAGGFVDDARYCSAFAREKSSLSAWGPVKIRYALRMKHLPEQLIDEGLSAIDSDSAGDRLKKLLSARWKTLQKDPQGRLKLIRYALSRGYGYDEVEAAVRTVCEASDW